MENGDDRQPLLSLSLSLPLSSRPHSFSPPLCCEKQHHLSDSGLKRGKGKGHAAGSAVRSPLILSSPSSIQCEAVFYRFYPKMPPQLAAAEVERISSIFCANPDAAPCRPVPR